MIAMAGLLLIKTGFRFRHRKAPRSAAAAEATVRLAPAVATPAAVAPAVAVLAVATPAAVAPAVVVPEAIAAAAMAMPTVVASASAQALALVASVSASTPASTDHRPLFRRFNDQQFAFRRVPRMA
ncbi:MAG: hypothetical protein FH759_06615 [Sediminimonas qiaohouensis]|uniref:Uncharacterized protein n=1 Tax=Sediminimonas qiaohouensis TaxID=552061 RepID=A0A7C9HAS9_9RHOB|nr:hypothetical protein [Sediminimonas qiaohouensis]